MTDRNGQPPQQPSPGAPQPNRILAEPATVAACAADYQAATTVRATIARQDARTRR